MYKYRALDSSLIIATLEQLERRVAERFPHAGLTKVCHELTVIARENDARAQMLARPHYGLRVLSSLVALSGIGLFAYIWRFIEVKRETESVYSVLQGIDAGFNILVLMGAAIIFLFALEGRWKRQQALGDLDELRSIVHVIDMHQLTKDPSSTSTLSGVTASSPKRDLTAPELVRYLDYCSEMLSLAAKVAAIYAQSSKDPIVIEASSDLQQITANLSAKIWQKINIAQAGIRAAPVPPAPAPAAAAPAPPPVKAGA